MATRTDVVVDFNESPRLAEVAAPSDEYNAQDVVDTTRISEQSFQGMSHPKLLDASGKQDIGDGVLVGITNAFQNMQVAFESRLTPTSQGTITTPDTNGTTLIDASAVFVTAGITRGAVVINFTDQSITEVLQVDSETQLTTRVLRAGIGDTYDLADNYKIWNIVQCRVVGGNNVAVDENGLPISPVFPTFGTQIVTAASSSATLLTADIADDIFDEPDGVETGITLRQALRVMLAALAGKADGATSTTMHFRDPADAKNRITATVDSSGNRTSIILDTS